MKRRIPSKESRAREASQEKTIKNPSTESDIRHTYTRTSVEVAVGKNKQMALVDGAKSQLAHKWP